MKDLLKHSFFILFFFFTFCSKAQEIKATSETIDGYPINRPMKISDNEYVYAAGKYGERSGLDLVKFTTGLQVTWKKPLPDGFIRMANWKDNIVVFSSPEWDKNTYSNIKTIKATLIDAKTGSTLLTKDILNLDDKFYIYPFVLTDSSDHFKGFLLRYSNLEHVKMFSQGKSFDQMHETQKADWVMLDDKMGVKSTTALNIDFNGLNFLIATCNTKGDLFFSVTEEGKLTAFKYSAETMEKAGTLSVILPRFSKDALRWYYGDLSGDEKDLVCSFSYRGTDKLNNTVTIRFDFSNNTAFSSMADPKTKMELEKSKGRFDNFEQFGIGLYNNKFITLQQYNSSGDYVQGTEVHTVYYNDDILVSFFDEKMQALKQISIKASFPTFTSYGKNPGYKIAGNRLIIFTNVLDGKKILLQANFKLKYIIIDLDKMEIISDTVVDLNSTSKSIIDASSTVWVGNTALLFRLTEANFFSVKDFKVKLEKVEFNY